jgi:hypothetical protein
LIIALGWLIGGFAPWYAAVFAGFFGALPLRRNVAIAFLIGFMAGFGLWFLGYQNLGGSSHPLALQMADVMGIKNALALTLIGSAIGGLLTALGAASGNVLKKSYTKGRKTFDR